MKKLFMTFMVCLFGIMAQSVLATEYDYPQEVKEAGYSYEQYQAIMSIPKLPNDTEIIDFSNGINELATSPVEQQKVVNLAKSYIGVPYVWGGASPSGFDCSGLVQYVYKNAVGLNLPRVTTEQEKSGKDVSLNALSPGDLLFWGSRNATHHVAIYIGNSQFIHAPQPGEKVKVTNMSDYYPSFARRVLNEGYRNEGNLDKITGSGNTRTITGWHVATNSNQGKYRFLFVMQNGKEVRRIKISKIINRPDVQKHMPEVMGSLQSGFETDFQINELAGKKVQFMHRYTNDASGNNPIIDFTFTGIFTL